MSRPNCISSRYDIRYLKKSIYFIPKVKYYSEILLLLQDLKCITCYRTYHYKNIYTVGKHLSMTIQSINNS